MREDYGLDLSAHVPTPLETLTDQRFDRVISLCDRVREVCPEFPGEPETIHWSLANPATGEPDDVTYPLFRETAAALATRIDFLLAALAHRAIAA
jgi:protein-tyrosine-phosphatase